MSAPKLRYERAKMVPLEINVKLPPKKTSIYLKYYLSESERKELIDSIGDSAVLLFEYYVRLASVGDQTITDKKTSEYFGWTTYKAKRIRLALIKNGWFKESSYTLDKHRKGVSYYLGKEAVAQTRVGDRPSAAA